jgi:hypothetical protein
MTEPDVIALCERATLDQFTPSEVKLASWLLTAGHLLGGFPVEVSMRDIKEGCQRGPIHIPGWGAHYRTIGHAFESLEERGVIHWQEGSARGFGYSSKLISLSP